MMWMLRAPAKKPTEELKAFTKSPVQSVLYPFRKQTVSAGCLRLCLRARVQKQASICLAMALPKEM